MAGLPVPNDQQGSPSEIYQDELEHQQLFGYNPANRIFPPTYNNAYHYQENANYEQGRFSQYSQNTTPSFHGFSQDESGIVSSYSQAPFALHIWEIDSTDTAGGASIDQANGFDSVTSFSTSQSYSGPITQDQREAPAMQELATQVSLHDMPSLGHQRHESLETCMNTARTEVLSWIRNNPGKKPNFDQMRSLRSIADKEPSVNTDRVWFEGVLATAMPNLKPNTSDEDIKQQFLTSLQTCTDKKQVQPHILRQQDKPFPCTLGCGKCFSEKEYWKAHEELNHPQEIWCCRRPLCQLVPSSLKIVARKGNFKKHMEDYHNPFTITAEDFKMAHLKIDGPFPRKCPFRTCDERHQDFQDWKERIDHLAGHFRGPWIESDWRVIPVEGEHDDPRDGDPSIDDEDDDEYEDVNNSKYRRTGHEAAPGPPHSSRDRHISSTQYSSYNTSYRARAPTSIFRCIGNNFNLPPTQNDRAVELPLQIFAGRSQSMTSFLFDADAPAVLSSLKIALTVKRSVPVKSEGGSEPDTSSRSSNLDLLSYKSFQSHLLTSVGTTFTYDDPKCPFLPTEEHSQSEESSQSNWDTSSVFSNSTTSTAPTTAESVVWKPQVSVQDYMINKFCQEVDSISRWPNDSLFSSVNPNDLDDVPACSPMRRFLRNYDLIQATLCGAQPPSPAVRLENRILHMEELTRLYLNA
ncbi:hypothetical protein MMC11_002933 [Xylographa trunciseda]|nr:hypothetical protein [Xylographa trunciseda]